MIHDVAVRCCHLDDASLFPKRSRSVASYLRTTTKQPKISLYDCAFLGVVWCPSSSTVHLLSLVRARLLILLHVSHACLELVHAGGIRGIFGDVGTEQHTHKIIEQPAHEKKRSVVRDQTTTTAAVVVSSNNY